MSHTPHDRSYAISSAAGGFLLASAALIIAAACSSTSGVDGGASGVGGNASTSAAATGNASTGSGGSAAASGSGGSTSGAGGAVTAGGSSSAGTGGTSSGGTSTGGGTGGACTAPLTPCDGACVDTQENISHCGECNAACDSEQVCQMGDCVEPCEGGLTSCDAECVDTEADLDYCGDCETSCGAREVCASAECVCDADATLCSDAACHYTDVDRAHCGECENACDVDEACQGGGCAVVPIPEEPYCEPTLDWPLDWTTWEFEILDIVNQLRAEGASCGGEGYFAPAPPLQMDPGLRCAARMHSMDMVERDFFDHTNPDGDNPGARAADAGYDGGGNGENIAGGNATPEATMQQWMESDGHCANIMRQNYRFIGVGYYPGGEYRHYWTQVFGG